MTPPSASSALPGTGPASGSAGSWVETAARFGYAAKGAVYAVIGGLATLEAAGYGGDTRGSRGALREIASQPFGQILLSVVTLGLAGYVAWRLVQAVADPEGGGSGDSKRRRLASRGYYLLSAGLHAILAYYGVTLLVSALEGGGGGGGSGWIAELMAMPWGAWLVGALGAGVVARGLFQFWKAYTESFRERIDSFDLPGPTRRWVLGASRVGLTARGAVFGMIGASLVYAAYTHDPGRARGLDESLAFLVTRPWILGALGLGLVCYAVYQWVKARYRLIGM